MHRCGSVFLLISAITVVFILALTGCLGTSTTNPGNGGVQSVTLSPPFNLSIDIGATQVFSASAKGANGKTVIGINIQFVVASGNQNAEAPLSILSNGNACAGTWDSTGAICRPGLSGIALVTAVADGVSSQVTTVYVHQHIASIQIAPLPAVPPQQLYDCFPQGQTWLFQAVAYSGNPPVDITNSVGPMNWSSSNSVVVSTGTAVAGILPNQIQTTARTPGITQLSAGVAGTTSSPYPYTTCLIQAIYLQIGGEGSAGNSITVNNNASVPVTATAIDTLYNVVDFAPLSAPPLTWSTTNPEVAAFTAASNLTGINSAVVRKNVGGATLTASCTPPTCNVGVLPALPIYSSNGTLPNGTQGYGTISVDVVLGPTATPPTYTAWAATTDCNNQAGCTSALFSVTPTTSAGANPIGPYILTVPRTPNSMMFNHLTAARLYIGSDQGLMYVDLAGTSLKVSTVSNLSTPCNVALCGQVLTVSNDGKLAVVSDTVSTPSQVYIYNGGSTGGAPVDLILSVPGEKATAAAFSPDQLKLFILTDAGNMYVYSTVDPLALVQLAAPATDVEFSADGSFAYVAGSPTGSVSAYSTCALPTVSSVDLGNIITTSNPSKIFPSPAVQAGPLGLTQSVLALVPPNIDVFTAVYNHAPLPTTPPLPGQSQYICGAPPPAPPPKPIVNIYPTVNFPQPPQSFDLGQGNFTPIYSQLVADGAEVLLVAQNIPAVLIFNVASATTSSIPLANSANPLSASASTDGSQVFIAACDQYDPNVQPPNPPVCALGSIHIVNTVAQGDYQQVPYVNNNNRNMCTNQGNPVPQCLPNLVAIQPD
ncbi:MAG: hypothetical protein ACLPLR_14855 [Terriglobales bacterium]